ncbi:extracellular solute-binding protein [Paludicola sp. MB14-C6]|uniref:ABC transporter substrate-binding protein n=1 Tax=Paludihabitans sp. MB14-C6 TaxID=3070656 RepID=UPI0027DD7027|nr:extracellular solute-binding protein [Paludicola sp. MB14-C6]WMJ22742.1 extracellular solute-binding protein [Paludicola sp. MB14-C6]
MKRYIALIVAIGLLIIAIVSIQQTKTKETKPKPTTITLMHGWGGANQDDIKMREIYNDFEKKYPQYKVILETYPSANLALERAQQMLAAGRMPDIINTSGSTSYLRNAIQLNMALDLMPYLQRDEDFLHDVNPQVLENWKTNGALFTIPDEIEVIGYWYNSQIFSKAGLTEDGSPFSNALVPPTWNEFFKICDRLESYIKENNLYSTCLSVYDEHAFESLAGAYICDNKDYLLYKNFNSYKPSDEAITHAVSFLKKLEKYTQELMNFNATDAIYNFSNGSTAMLIGSASLSSQLNDSSFKNDILFAPFPSNTGKPLSYVSAGSGYMIGNNTSEDKKKAAVQFIKYMVSDEVQKRILTQTQHMPQNPNLDLAQFISSNTLFHMAWKNADSASVHLPTVQTNWTTKELLELKSQINNCITND